MGIHRLSVKYLEKSNPSKSGGNFITRISSLIGNLHPFWNYIDSMLLYDGEENLSSFLQQLENNKDYSNIPNLYYLDDHRNLKRNEIVESKTINRLSVKYLEKSKPSKSGGKLIIDLDSTISYR
ncbi:hypothetical protein ACI3RH_13510, partial [Lactococcus lactis]